MQGCEILKHLHRSEAFGGGAASEHDQIGAF